MFIPIISRNTDADRPVLHEVHAVGCVALADDQLAIDQGAGQERIREVSSLVWLETILLFIYLHSLVIVALLGKCIVIFFK